MAIPDKWKNEIGYRPFMIKLVYNNENLFNYLATANQSPMNDISKLKENVNVRAKSINKILKSNRNLSNKNDLYQTGLGMSFPSKNSKEMGEFTKGKSIKKNKSELILPPLNNQRKVSFDEKDHEAGKKEIGLSKSNSGDLKLNQSLGSSGSESMLKNAEELGNSNLNIKPKREPLQYRKIIHKKNAHSYGDFLNAVNIVRKKIINPDVKKMVEEVNGYGPRCPNCQSCNNLNVDFYNEMRPRKAIDLLQYIKYKRVKLSNFD